MHKNTSLLAAITIAIVTVTAHAAPLVLTPNSKDLIIGPSRQTSVSPSGYWNDYAANGFFPFFGEGGSTSAANRREQNIVFGYLLPTLQPGESISAVTFRAGTITGFTDISVLGNPGPFDILGVLPTASVGSSPADGDLQTTSFSPWYVENDGISAGNNTPGDRVFLAESIGHSGTGTLQIGGTPGDNWQEFIVNNFYAGGASLTPIKPEVFFQFQHDFSTNASGAAPRYAFTSADGSVVALNDVTLTLDVVPEPSTGILLLIGSLLSAFSRRTRPTNLI